MKIDRDYEAPGEDTPGKAAWRQDESGGRDRAKKDPVCPGDKSEQSPFYTHGLVFLLQFPALLYGQIYVPKSGNHAKTKKYKGQPRGCMKYRIVEPVTDAQADHYGQGDGKTQATVIPQLPEQFLGIFFHDKERLPKVPILSNRQTSEEPSANYHIIACKSIPKFAKC